MRLKHFLAAAVLVAVFIFGAVAGWIIKPGVKDTAAVTAKVTVNPTNKQVKKSDVTVKVESQGQLTGSTKLTMRTGSGREVTFHSEQPAVVELAAVPVAGEIKTKIVDVKTGETIGEGSRPVSGETTVQVDGDQVKVDTTFDDEVTFAIEMPEPKKRLWHVGGMASWSHEKNQVVYDIYIQRDWGLFRTKKADWVIWVRGEMELSGDSKRVMGGVERRW